MKNHRTRIAPGSGWVMVMVALGMILAFAGGAQAEPQFTMDCKGCHDMPPLDSKGASATKKDPFTGAVPGDHETHATSLASSCVICHGSPAPTSNSHAAFKKSINMDPAMGYNRNPGFLNQTSVPPVPLGTCSNVSCHGDGKGGGVRTTPAWGSSYYTAPADCNQCHGVAPATGNHPNGANKHAQYYGTGVTSCYPCHSEHQKEAKPFAHATSSRAVQWGFAGGGSFSANKCSNVYCHSNGKGTAVDANWGATFPADCSGCHGNATSNTLSGKHAQHINNAALGSNGTNNGYFCSACHADTVNANSNLAITNPLSGKHVNSMVNYSGAYAGRGGATCTTVYCHSDGRGTFKALSSNGWNRATAMNCKSCHGSDPSPDFASVAGEPNYVSGSKGPNSPNSHKSHVQAAGATTCVYCHSDVVNTNGTTLTGSNHTNGSIEVLQGGSKTFGYDNGTKGCSNISCHGDGIVATTGNTATWGVALGCDGCHGNTAATLTTGSHLNHLNMLNIGDAGCNACHSVTASSNTTLVSTALHIDSQTEVQGAKISAAYNPVNKTCATSCHNSYQPTWGVVSSGACGTCHLAQSNTAGGLIDTYAHQAHFQGKAYGPLYDPASGASCANCHSYASEKAATHADGTLQVSQADYSFAGTGTCTPCHKQATNWKGGAVTCESCHSTAGGALSVIGGVTAPDKTLDATRGHGAWNALKCTDCHSSNTAHISGVLGDNDRLLVGNRSDNTTCNACHQNDTKVTARSLNMQGHVGSSLLCIACHEPHGTSNSYMVPATLNGTAVSYTGTNFINAQGTGVCQVCHTTTKFFKKGVDEKDHYTDNCLPCHPHISQSGTAFEPITNCDSCHGYPPIPRNVAISFGTQNNWSSAKYEDYSGGGGAHIVAAHVAKNAKASDGWGPCLMCHVDAAAAHNKTTPVKNHVDNVSVKIDPQYRFSNDYFATYTGAKFVTGANKTGTCFNVNCHFRPSKPWSSEK